MITATSFATVFEILTAMEQQIVDGEIPSETGSNVGCKLVRLGEPALPTSLTDYLLPEQGLAWRASHRVIIGHRSIRDKSRCRPIQGKMGFGRKS
jgi:hypothetical protein